MVKAKSETANHSQTCRLARLRTSNPWLISFTMIAVYYLFFLILIHTLQLPPIKDEIHFWATSLKFSREFPPAAALLKNYGELNTPLPFIIFGLIEKIGPGGIAWGRTVNLIFSLMIVLLVAGRPTPKKPAWRWLFAAIMLLGSPYFLGTSILLYTDIIAIFFTLAAVILHQRRRFIASTLSFALAISSRQYMLAFPLGLAGWEIFRHLTRQQNSVKAWLAPLASCLTLAFWYLFFGGFGPVAEISRQHIQTAGLMRLLPRNCNYFLACTAVYFCLPAIFFEKLNKLRNIDDRLFKSQPDEPGKGWRSFLSGPKSVRIFLLIPFFLALAFMLFPPWRNTDFSYASMGFLDKGLRLFGSDYLRLTVIYGLALITVYRFAKIDLTSIMVWANTLLMMKAHVAWDKYSLPLVVILWYLWSRKDNSSNGYIPHPQTAKEPQ